MNEGFLRQLLNESESTSLDFKREQYRFANATDEERSELLKDILAFANSFRRTDAYILIGVAERVDGPATVVGVSEHLSDANLQQFVNQKTNREVEFLYSSVAFDERSVGVIRIPMQSRPFYLKKPFGKLRPRVVYYRRGSSTHIADPETIARMGVADSAETPRDPVLELQFAELNLREALGTSIHREAVVFEPHKRDTIPDYSERRDPLAMPIGTVKRDYWRELADFTRIHCLASPTGLVIQNLSGTLARNVRVTIIGDASMGIQAYEELPLQPRPRDWLMPALNRIPPVLRPNHTSVDYHGDKWTVIVSFGNVQPRATVWAEEPFYLGPIDADQVSLRATVSGDNIATPQISELNVAFDCSRRGPLDFETLKDLAHNLRTSENT